MASSSDHVRLQLLVRKDARNARGVAAVGEALRALGFEVTGAGKASVSARASPDAFRAVFGDAMASELPVPARLAEYVESVSIAPRHTVIDRRGRR